MPIITDISPPVERAARWTLGQYEELIDAGVLDRRRVELIAGQITEMSPASSPHDACISITAEWLRERLGRRFLVREEKGIALPSTTSLPEPDLVICARRSDHYRSAKPTTREIRLVIEVAVSSLNYDREVKAPLYAASGIPEYWIVNLIDRQLERYLPGGEGVYTDPAILAADAAFSHDLYGSVAVADLLPGVSHEH